MKSFKEKHDLAKRKEQFQKVKERHPNLIPMIIEKAEKSKLPSLQKPYMLVEPKTRVIQLSNLIAKKISLNAKESIFIMANLGGAHENLNQDAVASQLHEKYKDEDGFVYITYSGNQTFGG